MLSGYGKEVENIHNEEKTELYPLSKTCSSAISTQGECVDEDALELHEEDAEEQSLKRVSHLEDAHSPNSPPESPASSSVRMTECKESATDVPEKLSHVFVLEPLFTDDEISPTTSSRFSSGEMRMQPLCIRFNEGDSPKPNNGNNVKASMDNKELTLAYIEVVVKSSGLSWKLDGSSV